MNYRIILISSGLLGMFAVYGAIMLMGAVVGESEDTITGNLIMTVIFTFLTLTALYVGLSQRKRAHKLFSGVIDKEFSEHGYLDAVRFSQGAGISLDDARDFLDSRYLAERWSRIELPAYNAEYRKS
jgi:NhaP-type Na+/H+ or K+/H+ antiporter